MELYDKIRWDKIKMSSLHGLNTEALLTNATCTDHLRLFNLSWKGKIFLRRRLTDLGHCESQCCTFVNTWHNNRKVTWRSRRLKSSTTWLFIFGGFSTVCSGWQQRKYHCSELLPLWQVCKNGRKCKYISRFNNSAQTENCRDANFFVNCDTWSYYNDGSHCLQWPQSWHQENSWFSVSARKAFT